MHKGAMGTKTASTSSCILMRSNHVQAKTASQKAYAYGRKVQAPDDAKCNACN